MNYKIICSSLIVALFSAFVCLMATFFLPSNIFIINDFTDITSKTLIQKSPSVNYWLDNITYTNSKRLFDLYRYNPLTRQIPPLAALSGIRIVDASKITVLTSSDLLVYNPSIHEIIISEPDNKIKQQKILALFANSQDLLRINAFYQHWTAQKSYYQSVQLPTETLQFIKNNSYEASAACLVWHYFHHHEAMFGPINAYHLGAANSENNFFYGWIANFTLYKMIQLTGDFNFQHYLTVLYSVYPLYYLAWIALMYFLTRDWTFTLLATLLGLSCVYLTGFEEIRFQPGLNPLRHYLDLPTIFLMSLFLKLKNSWRYGCLVLALGLTAVAVLNNIEFGLSLSAALIASLIVYSFCGLSTRYITVGFAAASVVLTGLALWITPKTPYSLLKYFFLGVATPSANFSIGIMIGFASLLVYLFLLLDKKNSLNSKLLIFFVCFYYQACSLYYVIYVAAAHVRALFPIAVIALILIAKNIFTYIKCPIEKKNFWLALFVPTSIFYIICQLTFVNIFLSYRQVKHNHQHYFWNFKHAQFFTDMDPEPFKNSVDLIDQYEKTPKVYMISKYDSVLYWLSNHDSALPYGTLAIGMPTKYEQSIIVDKLKHANSCYLFVDADIDSSHFGDVHVNYWPTSVLKKSTEFRSYDIASVVIYYGLADVFAKVQKNYHLIAKGDLIDVYQANRCKTDIEGIR